MFRATVQLLAIVDEERVVETTISTTFFVFDSKLSLPSRTWDSSWRHFELQLLSIMVMKSAYGNPNKSSNKSPHRLARDLHAILDLRIFNFIEARDSARYKKTNVPLMD